MKSPQDFSFNKSRYDRPTQKWVCGNASCGKACASGPNAKGQCQSTTECTPVKDGDRWQCNRPITHGGPCPDGPLSDGSCCLKRSPCKPVLSQRAKRGRMTFFATSIGLLVLIAYLAFGKQLSMFSPGPLSPSHAFITECETCHVLGDSEDENHSQGALCTDCHAEISHHEHPHGLSHIQASEQAACLNCHNEHEGQQPLLGATDVANCNACHNTSVSQFEVDHPPFGNLAATPAIQRAVYFDHREHADSYFPQQDNEPFVCTQCHQVTSEQQDVVTKDFAQTCRQCHQGDVDGSLFEAGVPLWSMPALDTDSLELSWDWPEDAADEEANLSLIQLWLLQQSNPNLSLDEVASGDIDLSDLSDLEEEQLAQIKDILTSSKRLLNALSNEETNRQLLSNNSLGITLDTSVVRQTYKQFYGGEPNREDEYDATEPGNSLLSLMSLQYRPKGHKDPLIKNLVELLASKPNRTLVDQELLRYLLGENTPGQCGQCHTLSLEQKQTISSAQQLWLGKVERAKKNRVSRFHHEQHTKGSTGLDCKSCHVLETNSENDLQPVQLESCTSCHKSGGVSADCTNCHQYHVLNNDNN